MKKALVLGAGGFIGGHLVNKLKQQGYHVTGVDIKAPEFGLTNEDVFILGDLKEQVFVRHVFKTHYDEVYQLAADMGGAGFVFTGDHDADIMHNSALINLNVIEQVIKHRTPRTFFSSSACVYPQYNQQDPKNPKCSEASAYPADPDSEYGWEKLFGERMYLAAARNHNLTIRIARYHNIYGPQGAWTGGREKSPAAICRKVAEAPDGGTIDVWGDGLQTRSFLYIDDCIDGTLKLMHSDLDRPTNIGSEEMVSINDLVNLVADIAGKKIYINHIDGPLGVRGRNSDNNLIRSQIGWDCSTSLRQGLTSTYQWIKQQVDENN